MRICRVAVCLGLTAVTPSLAHAQYDVTVLHVPGQGFSGPNAVNDAGQSVGYSDTASGTDAVLWTPSGKATVLQDAGGADYSFPNAINDAGWSVGVSYTSRSLGPTDPDAVLWSPSGKATVLQDVGGHDYSWAVAVNSSGWSVGYSNTETPQNGVPTDADAVLWSPSGKATVLHD